MKSTLIHLWSVLNFEVAIDKKVTVVESCFYTVAEMHDVDLPFLTDRDSARLAISAAQESPWGPITALGVFPTITGFVLAFAESWLAHSRAVSEYSPEG